nr:hypothetical protein [Tanacetum cinerariifolium]
MEKKLKFSKSQGDARWTAVKNILKYLRNTKDMFLVYGGDMKRELKVSCYTDVGYLTDADDMNETVFKSLGGYRELSSVRVNMETLAPTLCVDANVIDCWVALLNFEELALGYPTPTRHFFPTGCINQDNSYSRYGYASKYKEACDPL